MKGRAGSTASSAHTSTARHENALLKDTLPAEEASRADDQDHDHDREDRDRDALGVHPEGQQTLREPDHEGREDGAAHRAHASQDHDDEREQDHLHAHLRVDREDRSEQEAGQRRESVATSGKAPIAPTASGPTTSAAQNEWVRPTTVMPA